MNYSTISYQIFAQYIFHHFQLVSGGIKMSVLSFERHAGVWASLQNPYRY